jgi:hypothetical protein
VTTKPSTLHKSLILLQGNSGCGEHGLQCPAEMGYALEAIDTTMCFITQEDLLQGIQEEEPE